MVIAHKTPASTYHRHYRATPDNELASNYVTHTDYRYERRLNEVNHSTDSFQWRSSDWDTDSDDDLLLKKSLPQHQYKHLKFNEAYKKFTQKQATNDIDRDLQSLKLSDPQDVHSSTPVKSTEAKRQANQPIAAQRSDPKQEKTKSANHPRAATVHRFSKGHKKASLDNPRPASAPPSKPQRRPPFVNYGFRYKENHSGKKVTHNVNASSEVSEAAIRAQRRHQWDINRREEQQRKQKSNLEYRKKLVEEERRRDRATYESEYRRNFVGYNDLDYRLATPARMIAFRAAQDDLISSV